MGSSRLFSVSDLDAPDTVHVSPWLVKVVSTAILTGLGSIAIYMVVWAVNDARYKADLISRVQNIDGDLADIKKTIAVIPYNTQKIVTIERDIAKLESKRFNDR
jgi:hypothetical protein